MAKKTTTTSKTAGSKCKDELLKIIKDLDEKGCALLIEQANTYKKSLAKTDTKGSGTAITITPDAKLTSFAVQIGTIRKMFTRDAFREVVKSCHSAKNVNDSAKNLYALLTKTKKDFLIDNKITKPTDEKLISFIDTVASKYKPKA